MQTNEQRNARVNRNANRTISVAWLIGKEDAEQGRPSEPNDDGGIDEKDDWNRLPSLSISSDAQLEFQLNKIKSHKT